MTKTLRMIVKGGLGNQLFQYFAGRELSDETERKLVLDLSWYRRNVHKNGLLNQRNFMLNQYKFAETCTTLQWQMLLPFQKKKKKSPQKYSSINAETAEMKNRTQTPVFVFQKHFSNKQKVDYQILSMSIHI